MQPLLLPTALNSTLVPWIRQRTCSRTLSRHAGITAMSLLHLWLTQGAVHPSTVDDLVCSQLGQGPVLAFTSWAGCTNKDNLLCVHCAMLAAIFAACRMVAFGVYMAWALNTSLWQYTMK